MKYLHFPADLAATPIRLTTDEISNPHLVITEFFKFYNLNCIRVELGNWLEYAYSSDDPDMGKGINRINLMQFCYQLEATLEALYLLHYNPAKITK
jgi:hypothetical protein